MDAKTTHMILEKIAEMLDDQTCDVQVENGFILRPNLDTGSMEAERTYGLTVAIKVHGGGGIADETPTEAAMRQWARATKPNT